MTVYADTLVKYVRLHHAVVQGPVQVEGTKAQIAKVQIVGLDRLTKFDRVMSEDEFATITGLKVIGTRKIVPKKFKPIKKEVAVVCLIKL